MSFFKKNSKGFTIIELLVSIGIITSILSLVGNNQSDYIRISQINNIAEELAANIRLAQSQGINAPEGSFDGYSLSGSYFEDYEKISSTYGVNLSVTDENSASGNYTAFFDKKLYGIGGFQNGYYDHYVSTFNGTSTCPGGSGDQQCLFNVSMPAGYKISQICIIHPEPYDEDCNFAKYSNIYFLRPSIAAHITISHGNNSVYPLQYLSGESIKIVISDSRSMTKSVLVNRNGLVEVQ